MTSITTPQGILRFGDMEISNPREYNTRTQGKSLEKFQAHKENGADGPRQGLDPAGVGAETKEYRTLRQCKLHRASFQELLRF